MSYKGHHPSTVSPELSDTVSEHVLLHPEMDRILDTLGARHRRLVLLLLKDGVVETKDDVLNRVERDAETSEIKFVQNHLPKLESAGYVNWNPATGELSKGPRFGEVEPVLELIEDHAEELPP